MDENEDSLQPIFSHIEPVLAVHDISETVMYWQKVLGFPTKWTWGDPPNHGGVSWQKVFIQFSQDPNLAKRSMGNSVWIRLRRIKALYGFHQNKNAEIIEPLENKPWGMAQYTVKENNGYLIHFAGVIAERKNSEAITPRAFRIVERTPAIHEYRKLASAVGWATSENDTVIEMILSAARFAVVAEDTAGGETVGCALLLGDNASFYYVKDVMADPGWQGMGIGTAMMRAITNWLETNAANNALVGLITGEALEPFYQQFGFTQAFSMIRYMQHNEKSK